MTIIWQPKIALTFFSLIFLIVYLFYLSGEKKYKKGTAQEEPYFSGEKPGQPVRLEKMFWGFLKDMEKPYRILLRSKKEEAADYIFFFLAGLIAFLFILCLI